MDLVRRFETERGLVGSVGSVVCAEAPKVKPRDVIERPSSGVKNTTRIYDQTDQTDKTVDPFPFAQALDHLDRRCPDHIEAKRWQQCIIDAQRFLASWGDKALALGWTADELFGLYSPAARPHPSYSRLSRYDHTGLLWLLQGRRVIALTANTAVIARHREGPSPIENYASQHSARSVTRSMISPAATARRRPEWSRTNSGADPLLPTSSLNPDYRHRRT
jgi:hypothetical protein